MSIRPIGLMVIGAWLRHLRASRDLTRPRAAAAARVDRGRLTLIEAGAAAPTAQELNRLADALGAIHDPAASRYLLEEATTAPPPREFEDGPAFHDRFPGWAQRAVAVERQAVRLRLHCGTVLPPLLWTPAYAAGVLHAHTKEDWAMLARRAERVADLPPLVALVSESIVLQEVGAADRRAWLEHLRAVAGLPQVELRIAPLHEGGTLGLPTETEVTLRSSRGPLVLWMVEEGLRSVTYYNAGEGNERGERLERMLATAASAQWSRELLGLAATPWPLGAMPSPPGS
ncbi:transcriptional regulator with XRE-family HTH domain [Kitasatospora sp. MAP12-15]|uniref:Scr1 family TA system antitoxin-like transcriptional regulator n=1 Tax=unclassified Kitasatospora TaxID=2633591 RepID=UPI0024743664|nr:Scr1 family TA system antitoxin-like transcriptional regulator [Kitasatospora sp. MAP12-44]MDH6111405.1 transcriptional regulator with XRE-family HTH domain [Kitasatospora sp. MAP12-44]